MLYIQQDWSKKTLQFHSIPPITPLKVGKAILLPDGNGKDKNEAKSVQMYFGLT